MLGFLQSFAYGLFLSCLPWFLTGMIKPHLALPTRPPQRRQVFLRYWFMFPFIAFLLWLTSLWGGFSPTMEGWIAGLLFIALEVPAERKFRDWQGNRAARRRLAAQEAEAMRQRAALEQQQREAGMVVLDPEQPPVDADELVLALCAAKKALLNQRRPALAVQADRLYTRYANILDTLNMKFDAREVTHDRWRSLVAEVCRGAIDNLTSMSSLARGVVGVDIDFVQRRLRAMSSDLQAEEREALQRRLELVNETEARLSELSARNEAAMTALDDAAVAISRVETGRPQASVSADLALQELRRFMEKAALYGHRKDAR